MKMSKCFDMIIRNWNAN